MAGRGRIETDARHSSTAFGTRTSGYFASCGKPCRCFSSSKPYAEATDLYKNLVDAQARVLGEQHQNRLAALQDLGWLIARQNNFADGEKMVREAVETERRILGPQHVNTFLGMERLANIMGWQGR
jgi:DNA-directed RNA polymerase subunit N (RpoN/RPB10)